MFQTTSKNLSTPDLDKVTYQTPTLTHFFSSFAFPNIPVFQKKVRKSRSPKMMEPVDLIWG